MNDKYPILQGFTYFESNGERNERSRVSPRRRRVEQPPEEAEDGENVGEVTATVAGDEVRSGTLVDLDLLDCSVCCQPLSNPIFQVFVSSLSIKEPSFVTEHHWNV